MKPIKTSRCWGLSILCLALAATAFTARAADPADEHPSPQRRGGFGQAQRGVYKARITGHWFQDNTRVWYTNGLPGGNWEFVVVDAMQGKRAPAFDHEKLAASLSKATGLEIKGTRLPFSEIEFVNDSKAVRFEAAGKTWTCDLKSYQCTAATNSARLNLPEQTQSEMQLALNDSPFADESLEPPDPAEGEATDGTANQQQNNQQRGRGQRQGRRGGGGGGGGGFGGQTQTPRSPDGKWTALVKDYNVYLRSEGEGKEEIQLTKDGQEGNAYRQLTWSPNSQSLVAWRVEPGERKEVYLIQSSPPDGGTNTLVSTGRAVLRTRAYAQAGDKFSQYELSVFDVAARKQIKPDIDRYEHEYTSPDVHWEKDNRHFTYMKEERGHQRLRLIEVDAQNGTTRTLVDEQTKTFIWTAHTEGPAGNGFQIFRYLTQNDEILNQSERDGWRHIYLVDPKASGIVRQITKGEWVVRGINRVDEDQRQIWFCASGMNAKQDPYFIHFYRINFDGTGLVALTDGNGNHSVQYSPDRKFLIDTYSRPDAAPRHELRRVSDGKLVCLMEEADITELKATGWKPPIVFVAKGRDDKTEIWGNIHLPNNFDPNKKYPILEDIYGGPQDSYTPKTFSGMSRYDTYTRAGFVVVKLDGMGTANRSKAFHDVCWHNLKDGGFLDRIAWIKAAAAKHPGLDVTRVGIFGTSAGGQNAAAAVIFHPEFYKVAVANSGCHDNRIDKASWNEQWMGYMPPDKIWKLGPDNKIDPDNWYSQCSNIDNAGKLGGHLLLIWGELDTNVPPESTLRLVDALVKSRKDFDQFVVPGADHGAGSAITQRRTQDFFMRHLQGIEPPNRNAESIPTSTETSGI